MTLPSPSITVAAFIASHIDAIDKTQREIAESCGFENANVLSMIKNGQTRLPINRVGPLAKALEVDPAHLLRLTMTEYSPETWEAIEEALHGTILTANELALVKAYRLATGDTDPKAVVVERPVVLAMVAA